LLIPIEEERLGRPNEENQEVYDSREGFFKSKSVGP
jgi:hypothetical protein